MLVFTPAHSQMALGSVVVRKRPALPVSPHQYRLLLADRIQAMIDDVEPEDAKPLLRELAVQEGLVLTRDLSNAGVTLAEYSQTLREMAAYPVQPILPEQFEEDIDTADAIAEEVLEEWVTLLLR